MAQKIAARSDNTLIALIGDEVSACNSLVATVKSESFTSCSQDTITGFMLAGVGDVDSKKQTNYLTVTSSTSNAIRIPRLWATLLVAETSVQQIEDAFTRFTKRKDVSIILINQHVRSRSPSESRPFTTAPRPIHCCTQCSVHLSAPSSDA